MKAFISACGLALAIAPAGQILAQNNLNLSVIGHIKGTFDGKSREWQTFTTPGADATSSANWRSNAVSVPDHSEAWSAMLEHLPPEQRAQLEALGIHGGDVGPMADMLAQMTGMPLGNPDSITLSITGLDPDSPNQLREGVLSLEVILEDPAKFVPGTPRKADITYIVESSEGSMPQILYISDHDRNNATITLDEMDLNPDSGHASGSFSALLCRFDMRRLMEGVDMNNCVETDGKFDTRLMQE